MDFLLSRQPIFGTGVNIAGYELRTRPLDDANNAPTDSGRTFYSMLTEDALSTIAGQHPCFVNLTHQALAKGWCKSIQNKTVLAYFDDFAPDSCVSQELVKLANGGVRLAVSGKVSPASLDLFGGRLFAVKLNVLDFTPDELEKQFRQLKTFKNPILAGGVDTYDDLEFCKDLGFDLFQGHFISRAAVKGDQDVPVNRLTMMRALAKLQDQTTPLPELEKIVSQDAGLSYKLLSFANSAAMSLPRKVSSIGHALRMVGVEMMRRWASLLLFSSVDDKPRELMTVALVRAKMCEMLSASLPDAEKDVYFSAGLLSVIDALLDCSMEKALAKLPLTEEVQAALTDRTGPIGQALKCATAYERADWDNIQFNGMPLSPIRDIYMDSIAWARELSTGLLS